MRTRHIIALLMCIVIAAAAGCAARDGSGSGESAKKPGGTGETGEIMEVTLYFSDDQAMYVVPESREMTVPQGASREYIIKSVIELLIEGPKQKGHFRAIPEGTRVKSVVIEGDTVTVDFSEELRRAHGAAGEAMVLNSLVNTLTEFDYIKKVFFTIEGQVEPLEHFIPDEPLIRNEDAIKK